MNSYRYGHNGLAQVARALAPRRQRPRRWPAIALFAVFLGIFCRADTLRGSVTAAPNPAARSNEMRHRIAEALAAITITAGAAAQDAVQWREQDGGNGHWYQFDQAVLHWAPHRERAAAQGGYLATVTSGAEHDFVASLLFLQDADIWLGGMTNWPSPITWITGESFEYVPSYWCGYNPGGGYAIEICGRAECLAQFCWNIESEACLCWPGNRAIYEWSADCNSDGIVDYGQIRSGELADANANNIPDCCESATTCIRAAVEWPVANDGNGHWYAVDLENRIWSVAKSNAESVGGHLASVTSESERAVILSLVSTGLQADVWLGASRSGSQNVMNWVTGEPFSYAPWGAGHPNFEPDRCCLELNCRLDSGEFGLWSVEYPYAWGPGQASIIEWSADCNSDGIVDFGQIRAGELADVNANNIPDCCEDGSPCGCVADIVQDGMVNGVDLAAVINAWGTDGGKLPRADTNRDGVVNGVDLAQVLGSWGPCH